MKIAYWVFLLILVYLAVAYYKGTVGVIQTGGGFITRLVTTLQGRDPSTGANAGYAK